MATIILARTTRGKEYLYSRNKAVEIPAGWPASSIEQFIEGLNKHFKLTEIETYHIYQIDQYDNVYPEYKAYKYRGQYRIKRI